jgi:hypothetical protein
MALMICALDNLSPFIDSSLTKIYDTKGSVLEMKPDLRAENCLLHLSKASRISNREMVPDEGLPAVLKID